MNPAPIRAVLLLAVLAAPARAFADPAPPHIDRGGSAPQLIVGGKPFLIRGGELGNSSGEPGYLKPYWPKLKALNLNTVVTPVYWDQFEPAEGRFDFASVDGLLAGARANGMHLVLLWFGSWKNSMACYAPAWVKSDPGRFPRSRDSKGKALEILSPFSDANRDADAAAFAALLRHLRQADGREQTVILVQVENEIGMIPEARDHCPDADKAFASAVPAPLTDYLAKNRDSLSPELRARWTAAGARPSGTWREVFGDDAGSAEIFMAWHYARYAESVARAGLREYPLPLYANAALIRPGRLPGEYPSGGPLPHLFDIWRAGAPSLAFLSPDIYFQNFAEWADRYARPGNALFIPEALRSPDASVNGLYAYGADNALGFSPFGIESIGGPAEGFLAASNDLVRQLTPLILESRGTGSMTALLPPEGEQRQPIEVPFAGLVLGVSFEKIAAPALADGVINEANDRPASSAPLPAGAIVIRTGPDELLFGGIGVTVTFASPMTANTLIGILSCEEGRFDGGKWTHLRWLNGDQTHQGRHMRLEPGHFDLQRVRLYRYK